MIFTKRDFFAHCQRLTLLCPFLYHQELFLLKHLGFEVVNLHQESSPVITLERPCDFNLFCPFSYIIENTIINVNHFIFHLDFLVFQVFHNGKIVDFIVQSLPIVPHGKIRCQWCLDCWCSRVLHPCHDIENLSVEHRFCGYMLKSKTKICFAGFIVHNFLHLALETFPIKTIGNCHISK